MNRLPHGWLACSKPEYQKEEDEEEDDDEEEEEEARHN